MDTIAPLRNDVTRLSKNRVMVAIEDPRSRQRLEIDSDDELAAFRLDGHDISWLQGEKHPDGVLIGCVDGATWVCFIELKGRLDNNDPPRGFDQLLGGVDHFHPSGPESHGGQHHGRWLRGLDQLPVSTDHQHRVVGLIVAMRGGARAPSQKLRKGPKEVVLATVPASMAERNVVRVSFRELLERAGLLAQRRHGKR